MLVLAWPATLASGQAAEEGPVTEDRIEALVRDLGDRSYEVRTNATRRLCAVGLPATEALRRAAEGPKAEIALRARAVLDTLDRLLFAGVDIELAFTASSIRWDEPVDLELRLHNRCPYPSRVAFEPDAAKRAEATKDAAQVGAMLDVADWLRVRGPDGRDIELRVDDILTDESVAAAVDERVRGGGAVLLPPGERAVLSIPSFNRGWARYPLLDAGEYTVSFDYTPPWEDEALAAERAGRVMSNTARVKVTTSAPQAVTRSRREALLSLEPEGTVLVAALTNTSDLHVMVNANFGASAPFAQAHWVYGLGEARHEIAAFARGPSGWRQFDASKLVELAPGERVVLARIGLDLLRQSFATEGGAVDGAGWTVHFTYSSLLDRQWQLRQGDALRSHDEVPEVLRSPLPRRMLSARLASDRLCLPAAAPEVAPIDDRSSTPKGQPE